MNEDLIKQDEYIAASIDFIKQYHKEGYDLLADKIIAEGLEELEQTLPFLTMSGKVNRLQNVTI